MEAPEQSSEPGTFQRVQTPEGMTFKEIPAAPVTGTAYVEPEKAKTRRELELEAGKARVAENQKLVAERPPMRISQQERQAQGSNVPVFRPNMLNVDRSSTGLGPMMRKVGSKVAQSG